VQLGVVNVLVVQVIMWSFERVRGVREVLTYVRRVRSGISTKPTKLLSPVLSHAPAPCRTLDKLFNNDSKAPWFGCLLSVTMEGYGGTKCVDMEEEIRKTSEGSAAGIVGRCQHLCPCSEKLWLSAA
jgi:hypothetical protein